MEETYYDIIAVNIKTGEERIMEKHLNFENAEAYIKIAVMRRGVEEEFFKKVVSNHP